MKTESAQHDTIAEYFRSEKRTTEFGVWLAGFLLGIFAAIVLLSAYFFRISLEDLHYECWVRRHSGLLCPGCGGTRALFYFLHGSFVRSFIFHPLVPYAGVIYLLFMFRGAVHFLSKGRFPFMRFRLGYVYTAIAVLLVQFLVKIIFLLGYGVVWI